MSKEYEEGDLNAPDDLDESAIAHLAGDQDENAEPEKEHFSKNVQKRISKEVKKRKVLEGERDTYRHEAEKANRELAEFKVSAAKDRKETLESETESLKTRAKTALEDGESDSYMDLNDQILDHKVELSRVNTQIDEAPPEPAAKQPGPSEAAQSWLDDNTTWLEDDTDKAGRAQRIEAKLKDEGYSVTDPGTYQELDRRLNGAKPDDEPGRSVPPVNMPGASIPSESAQNTRRLSKDDLVTMRQYGFKPENPAHRAEWLASKAGV